MHPVSAHYYPLWASKKMSFKLAWKSCNTAREGLLNNYSYLLSCAYKVIQLFEVAFGRHWYVESVNISFFYQQKSILIV